jgi:hypothetical protein
MADALRSGVAARRQEEQMTPGADAARLTALGNLEGLGPVAKPGTTAPVVKFVRRALEVFLRPWLAMQTIFNTEISRRFDESATIVRDVRRRLPLLEEGLLQLDARLRALEPHAAPAMHAEAPVDSYAGRLFIHSRLPPPPATVALAPEVERAVEQELVRLGYQVVHDANASADACVGLIAAGVSLDQAVESIFNAASAMRDASRLIVLLHASADTASWTAQQVGARASTHGWKVVETLVCNGMAPVVGGPMPRAGVTGMTLIRRRTDAPPR